MNPLIQTKTAILPLLIPPLLACFAAVLILAPTPAAARDRCPSTALSRGTLILSPVRSASLQHT